MAEDGTMHSASVEQGGAQQVDISREDSSSNKQDSNNSSGIDALLNVTLEVRVIIGRCKMPISEILGLTSGSVIELDRKVGELVDIMINDRLVAQGELVKVNGDQIGVALREIIKDFVPSA